MGRELLDDDRTQHAALLRNGAASVLTLSLERLMARRILMVDVAVGWITIVPRHGCALVHALIRIVVRCKRTVRASVAYRDIALEACALVGIAVGRS